MAEKKFVRIDNCAFTKIPSLIKSVRADKDYENGALVSVDELEEGAREVHTCSDATTGKGMIGVICTPEVEYDERGYHGLDTFVNKKGEVMRVGILQEGDIFSIGNDDSTEDITMGTLTAKHRVTEVSGRYKYNVLEVIKTPTE